MPQIHRVFRGKEYTLDAVAFSRRSADFMAKARREKGYFARVSKIENRRFGIWIRERRKQ